MLKQAVDFIKDITALTDGITVVCAVLAIFFVLFLLNLLFFGKSAERYLKLCFPFLLIYAVYFVLRAGYSLTEKAVATLFVLFFMFLLYAVTEALSAVKEKGTKKNKYVQKESTLSVSTPPEQPYIPRFNYVRQNGKTDGFITNIDTDHAKKLLCAIKEKPLNYADRKEVESIDSVIRKACEGLTPALCSDFNDAMSSLLKIVSRYG